MRNKKHILIASILGLSYVVVLLLKRNAPPLPAFFESYFTDLLCMPLILFASLMGIRRIKRFPNFILSPAMIIAGWAYVSVVFEFVLPRFSPGGYFADLWDVAAYGAGALAFWLWQRQALGRNVKSVSN